jgi:chromosome segregation ATPase
MHKRGEADVIRTGSGRKLTESGEPEQQVKDMKRLLAKAEQKIRKLQEKVADERQRVRELQAQANHDDNLASEREELKADIVDLKGEIRELTRANREQVQKIEALRTETAKLKADAMGRKPSGMTGGSDLRGLRQPSLS